MLRRYKNGSVRYVEPFRQITLTYNTYQTKTQQSIIKYY
jgi:hypothetical protein